MAADRSIAGNCPMGCGETLFLGAGGFVTCSYLTCPRPDAASRILADAESEHIVEFGRREFTVRHPLKERLDDALMRCDLHEHITRLAGPPVKPGRYRARPNLGQRAQGAWTWEPLPASADPPAAG
jgi:hypothetical protein